MGSQASTNRSDLGVEGFSGQDSFKIQRGHPSRIGDIEMGSPAPTNSAGLWLEGFSGEVWEIARLIDGLSKLLKRLQDANEESKSATNAVAIRAIMQCVEKDIDEVGNVARTAKAKFGELEKDNLANRREPGCGKGTNVDRFRTSTTNALKKNFLDKISELQMLRESMHKEYLEFIERSVFTVTGTRVDAQTIYCLMDTVDGEMIFKRPIQDQARGQVMDTLAEIQERHNTVKEMERMLLELQQGPSSVDPDQSGISLQVVWDVVYSVTVFLLFAALFILSPFVFCRNP